MTKGGVAAQEAHHGHLSAPAQASQEPWALSKAWSIHNCQSLQRMCKHLDTEKLVTGKKKSYENQDYAKNPQGFLHSA